MWSPKKVVIVAHSFLVCTNKQKCKVVGLVGIQGMKFEDLLHVVQVDELIDDTVGVAGNVAQGRILCRWFVQAVNGNNGKELIKSPMVRYRTKHGEVHQILGAEQSS